MNTSLAAHSATAPAFRISRHPQHKRLRHISINQEALEAFFDAVANIDVQNLEYVPYTRFILAEQLERTVGKGFGVTLCRIMHDRATGGFTLGVQGIASDSESYIKFGTAVGHLLGASNHDAMSGTYYARFLVKDTDSSDSYLRQAYRLFTLHNDGTFAEEKTEWVLMMKFDEANAVGGESRLMHLDDWPECSTYCAHPLGSAPFLYKAPSSKNVHAQVERPVFFLNEYGLSMSFIDQFAQPRSDAEARYLHDLSASMEASPAVHEVPLPVGDLVVINNYFWLHGRAPFKKHPGLHRELMRQRGTFSR
ncbi:glutarate dioxygenase GlaH [Dyella flava]|uniref:Carbon starvation induced protein CsiD n=1 Tax=Dyella flava TaxID=1920170 RepID=A0ABS2K1D1_9GAMM|nr:glutarate dioxygenase GlaH [Dyella flava]MBM7124542.1 carbon starvation induced protein CsiD [Dyella flava]GLQ51788.1 protein CsiD [Dyella flava]